MPPPRKNIMGFTLVELSIVIVIIGLLVGGVVAGQSLVRQAQMRSLVSDFNAIQSAMYSFKLKYNALPGDMSNANDYWPGCNSGATAAECNGNNNRIIQDDSGTDNDVEGVRAWQHLDLAELYKSSMPGTSTGWNRVPGVNIPMTSWKNAGWRIDITSQAWWVYNKQLKHLMILGKENAGGWNSTAAFTAGEASQLDIKVDGEANANTGVFQAAQVNDPGNCHAWGVYDLTKTNCLVAFLFNL